MIRSALLALAAVALGAAAPPLRMNDIQVIGSHNSFKARIPDAVMARLRTIDPKLADGLDYYHLPLTDQLDHGVRQIEIDIFADPKGDRYAEPKGELWARAAGETTAFDRAAMRQPGFKVFHIPDIDYISTCVTLRRCLGEVDRWSRRHPDHLPIMITINAADTPSNRPGITDPIPLDDPALLDALDGEIRSAFRGNRLITPDEVRGNAPSLSQAIRQRGWPSLSKARGRVYILFDVRKAVSNTYRLGHPSLAGRAMFGWYPEDDADSAIQIVQDPLADKTEIRRWVQQGLIVRTRSDANTVEARAKDHRKSLAAMASGAQAISTDYYPGAPDPLRTTFTVTLPRGEMARCSPVRVPAGCRLRR
ncbi:hypothetical protein AWL63_15465 [Sphingomonas panacis]|uniref:Calcium-dependent phosphoinositide phospholipase C n=1 Tax=Sphingomonas panacis TaxID=1560345 RepID=A0A1B3ZCJ4_9SPHN|nr:Ca2+-dependent phosphoinositide-specific phospholipase C [Sphingomonas panacis]AOH85148.1 hypothetical protein AWL63_15465 [Sphingomonas panacis]